MSEELKAAQARIAELEAWKAEEIQVMSPLMDYARGVCAGPIGCSLADWLIRDHKRLRAELSALKAQEPIGWYTEDHLDDKSATTYSWTVAERWVEKGWPVSPLYAAPAAPAADAWIPVSERLPGDQGHDSEEVLCFLNGHCSRLDNECRQGGGWGIRLGYYDADIGTFRVFGRPKSHVTHWMPLPAAPIKIEANRHDQ